MEFDVKQEVWENLFILQLLKIPHSLFQEVHRDFRLLFKAAGREQICVGGFAIAVFEIPCLDPAFVHQCAQTVIGFAQAYSQVAGELTLGHVRVLFEVTEHF